MLHHCARNFVYDTKEREWKYRTAQGINDLFIYLISMHASFGDTFPAIYRNAARRIPLVFYQFHPVCNRF